MSNERKQSKLDELIQEYCPNGVENLFGIDYKSVSMDDIPNFLSSEWAI